MRFIDLHVHSSMSSGRDSPERMLEHARELGIEVCLCDGVKGEHPSGIEVHARSRKELRGRLGQALGCTIVHGGDYGINRLAVADRRVDVLAHPDLGRKDSGVDSIIARAAGENSVALEVNLGRIMGSWGLRRMYAVRNVRRTLLLARKYGAPLVAATGAKSAFELRGAEGVRCLLGLMGFEEKEAEEAMYGVPIKILRGELKSG